MLARLVPQSELGKVYGLLAILDAALPFAGIARNQSYKLNIKLLNCLPALPVATHIWDSTIDTMPAAFCLLNAGVTHLFIIVPSPTVAGAVSSWPPVPCCQLGPDNL